jgi:hypothetical protein
MKSVKFLSVLLVAAFAVPAFAQSTNTPNIDQRQANQQKRIANGAASGALTAKETQNLEKREAKIQADKDAAKADGKVTAKERVKLEGEENRASKKIFNKKHNAKTAQ